ncbi:hypothetical protein BJY52DRAFT_1345104, partial [Lactarius psammicola]
MPKQTMAGFILKNKTSHFLYITKKHCPLPQQHFNLSSQKFKASLPTSYPSIFIIKFFGALLYMFPLSTIVKFTVLNIFSGFFWFFQCLGGDCYVSTGTWLNLSGITVTLPINNLV